MNSKYLIVLVVLAVATTDSLANINDDTTDMPERPILISIFYDANSNNRKVMLEPLQQVFCKVEQYMNLTLVPFGKTQRINNEFICQNGPEECKRLAIHNCVLSRLTDSLAQLDYVNCDLTPTPKRRSVAHEQDMCIRSVAGLNVEEVKNCASSEEGHNLMLEAEAKTKIITPQAAFPTIVYDNVYNAKVNLKSTRDLEPIMCFKLLIHGFKNKCRKGRVTEQIVC